MKQNPLTSNSVQPALMGSVVLKQVEASEMTLTLQDPTGYAVINIVNCPAETLPSTDDIVILLSQFKLQIAELGFADVVSADVDFKNVCILKAQDSIVAQQKKCLSTTAKKDFQFKMGPLLS